MTIDAVVLTHAHLDHVGYLPRLVAQGFKGRVFCTPGTMDLCRLVLPDSGRIQEEDARQANKHGYSKHQPGAAALHRSDALDALTQLQPVGYHRPIEVAPGISVEFMPAGHLLGSAFVVARLQGGPTILFGGDLGRYARPVLPDPVERGAGRRRAGRVHLRRPRSCADDRRRAAGAGDSRHRGSAAAS